MSPHYTSSPSPNRSLPVFEIVLLAFFLALCAFGIASSTAQAPQAEREVEDKIPKHLPIKVKVKNLNNEKWTRELEMEVTNTGEKPIYALHFALVSHEVQSDEGHDIAVVMIHYGRWALIDFAEPLQSDDVPIQPGETHTFKISEGESRGWEGVLKRRNLPKEAPKKLRLVFDLINFGDGTGFWTTGGVPVDMHKKQASNGSCIGGAGASQSASLGDSPFTPIGIRSQTQFPNIPADFLPVNFSLGVAGNLSLNAAAPLRQDTCCAGQPNCSRRKRALYTCCFGTAETTQVASCNDPRGVCGTDYELDREGTCDEFGTICPEFFTDPCPPPNSTPTPTPTPTPTGTPTPTPTATPTPTPTPEPVCDPATPPNRSCFCDYVFQNIPSPAVWDCQKCLYGPSADFNNYQTGCPDYAYTSDNVCCVCSLQNPGCPTGTYWNTDVCQCVSTGGGGGGGGGGGSGGGGGGGGCYYYSDYYYKDEGGCTETYFIQGFFCDDGSFTGGAEYVGSDCLY